MSKVKPPSRNRPTRPPGCSFFSKTSTPKPMSLSRIAAASPPMPAPTMATRFVAKKPPLLCPSCLSEYVHEYTREMLTRSAKAPGKGAHTWMTEATTKAAVLTKRGVARRRAGHPWIYRSNIAVVAGVAGDVARVVDRGDVSWVAPSTTRGVRSLRIFTREDEALDEAWLRNRIERAQTYRDDLRRRRRLPPPPRRGRRHTRPGSRPLRRLLRPSGGLGGRRTSARSHRRRSRRPLRSRRRPFAR